MGKPSPSPDFNIHIDGSCLTNSTDLGKPKEREVSAETVVHDPSPEGLAKQETAEEKERKAMEDHSNLINERISAQIHEAARRVVADIERDHYEEQEDSIISTQTDEIYEGDETELSYGVDGTEMTYDEGTEVTYEGTEATYESDAGGEETYAGEGESELDIHLEQAITAWEPTATSNDQDSSSHHDGDVSDDVFSEASRSQRSSINSVHDLGSADEVFQKELTSPAVGEDAASAHSSKAVSRIPSINSDTPEEVDVSTPSKVMHRPPFRTPSSVRAMQMGSPTPSIFSSPRSAKRHMPTVSRIGTPTSQFSPSKRTPGRFKAKKEQPLVLLHVTVLPLQWSYANAMTSRDIPESLEGVKESWSLLQDKLADTVRERGILLAHPQDSYEVLEERLLDALELPVLPRAQILKCGHYIGPSNLDDDSSDDETTKDSYFIPTPGADRKYCEICCKDVKLEDTGEVLGKKKFNVKVFASNGLMRAGAWSMAWREMERVDVEIEPWVETGLRAELELLSITTPLAMIQDDEDEFVDEDEDEVVEAGDRSLELDLGEQQPSAEEAEIRRKFEEEEIAHKLREEEEALQRRKLEEEEEVIHRQKLAEEEAELLRQKMIEEQQQLEAQQRLTQEEEMLRRKMVEEEMMREVCGGNTHAHPPSTVAPEYLRETLPTAAPEYLHDQRSLDHNQQHPQQHHQQYQHQQQHQRAPRREIDPDSLPELLLAAFKVLMRDKKNIAIGILSALVLLLALRPANVVGIDMTEKGAVLMNMNDVVPKIAVALEPRKEEGVRNVEQILENPAVVAKAVEVETKPVIEIPAIHPVVAKSAPLEEVLIKAAESESAQPKIKSTKKKAVVVEAPAAEVKAEQEKVVEVENVEVELPVTKREIVEEAATEDTPQQESPTQKEETMSEVETVEAESTTLAENIEEQVPADEILPQNKVEEVVIDKSAAEKTFSESTTVDSSVVASEKIETEVSEDESNTEDISGEDVDATSAPAFAEAIPEQE